MTDQNAMCKCGRARIADGCKVEVILPSCNISWGICNLCGQELENGAYPKKKEG